MVLRIIKDKEIVLKAIEKIEVLKTREKDISLYRVISNENTLQQASIFAKGVLSHD